MHKFPLYFAYTSLLWRWLIFLSGHFPHSSRTFRTWWGGSFFVSGHLIIRAQGIAKSTHFTLRRIQPIYTVRKVHHPWHPFEVLRRNHDPRCAVYELRTLLNVHITQRNTPNRSLPLNKPPTQACYTRWCFDCRPSVCNAHHWCMGDHLYSPVYSIEVTSVLKLQTPLLDMSVTHIVFYFFGAESTSQKFSRKIQSNPFIPLGLFATGFCLVGGIVLETHAWRAFQEPEFGCQSFYICLFIPLVLCLGWILKLPILICASPIWTYYTMSHAIWCGWCAFWKEALGCWVVVYNVTLSAGGHTVSPWLIAEANCMHFGAHTLFLYSLGKFVLCICFTFNSKLRSSNPCMYVTCKYTEWAILMVTATIALPVRIFRWVRLSDTFPRRALGISFGAATAVQSLSTGASVVPGETTTQGNVSSLA